MVATSERFFEHGLLTIGLYEPDLPALQAAPTRLVVGVGADSGGQFADRTALAFAERLDSPPVVFPGGHTGFASHPGNSPRTSCAPWRESPQGTRGKAATRATRATRDQDGIEAAPATIRPVAGSRGYVQVTGTGGPHRDGPGTSGPTELASDREERCGRSGGRSRCTGDGRRTAGGDGRRQDRSSCSGTRTGELHAEPDPDLLATPDRYRGRNQSDRGQWNVPPLHRADRSGGRGQRQAERYHRDVGAPGELSRSAVGRRPGELVGDVEGHLLQRRRQRLGGAQQPVVHGETVTNDGGRSASSCRGRGTPPPPPDRSPVRVPTDGRPISPRPRPPAPSTRRARLVTE